MSSKLKLQGLNGLLSGIIMSVCAVLIWFLLSHFTTKLGAVILCAVIVMIAVNFICFLLIKQKRKITKICVRSLFIILNVVVFFSITVYTLASMMLFYPNSDEESYQVLQTRDSEEEITIQTEQLTLSGWMLHNTHGEAPLVLYFGGNGENASRRIMTIEDDLQTVFEGYNVAIIDYPGYGKSTGSPSEESLKSMGLAAYDALVARDDVKSIVMFGYSIGTGLANYVASERDVAGMILMAPYADGYDLYNSMVNIFYGPLRLMVAFRMESISFAENVAVQPLILASKNDEMVGFESSERLSKAYPEGCQFEVLDDLKHNDFWGSEIVQEHIEEYLQEGM